MSLLDVKNVSHSFSHQNQSQTLFQNLNFQIEPHQFVSLLGPSGCGKSTLLRLLGNLIPPSRGEIVSRAMNHSFVFQEPRLLPWRTCLENTLLPLEIQKKKILPADETRAQRLLEMLGLKDAQKKFSHQLSGGMKMRTALARGLITEPELLLFDEPFAALDETTRLHLQTEFRTLFEKSRWTVIFVTHSIEEACFLSDRILIFAKTRENLIEYQPKLPMVRRKDLRDEVAFFEEVKAVRKVFEKEMST